MILSSRHFRKAPFSCRFLSMAKGNVLIFVGGIVFPAPSALPIQPCLQHPLPVEWVQGSAVRVGCRDSLLRTSQYTAVLRCSWAGEEATCSVGPFKNRFIRTWAALARCSTVTLLWDSLTWRPWLLIGRAQAWLPSIEAH
ncbi:hypothetical protein XELAEV_18039004mg [Xenopus laevis]|uniref:Uncharacterized protein n=1 Tax=Xenopus laevis TaxID=8355 RepID=A0A974C6V8_XENLA|nr:hypothetical protein XELAEV_18039004mg [Xenopus laevis]